MVMLSSLQQGEVILQPLTGDVHCIHLTRQMEDPRLYSGGCIVASRDRKQKKRKKKTLVACDPLSFRIMTCNHSNQDFLQHQRCIQLNKPQALLETCHTLGAQLPLGLITMTTAVPSAEILYMCECVPFVK